MAELREDQGLAFMLQYENVAWYDAGEVRILDRRVYPARTEFVTCRTHGEVAQAVTDMKLEELMREVREHNNFARRVRYWRSR